MKKENRKPGRPKIIAPFVRMSVAVNQKTWERIEALAEDWSYTKAEAVRTLINQSLRETDSQS